MACRLTATLALLCLGAGQAWANGRRPAWEPGLFGEAKEGHEGGIHEQEDFQGPGGKGKGKAKKSLHKRRCIGKGGHEMCAKENMFCHKHRMGCVKCPCFEPKDAFDGECPAECAAVVFKPEQPCEKVTDKLVGWHTRWLTD